MNLMNGVLGGLIGAAAGALIWAVVSFYTGYEIGWIAWGIGALCGFGVAVGTHRKGGPAAGVLAVVLSLLGIAAGKWGATQLFLSDYLNTDDIAISEIADDIIAEQEEAGQPVRRPRVSEDDYSLASEYHPAIWTEAQQRWNALSAAEQDQVRKFPPLVREHFMLAYIADAIVEEKMEQNQPLAWPEGMDYESAWRKSHYPADIWSDAESRWNAMDTAEQAAYQEQVLVTESENYANAMSTYRSYATSEGFFGSFSLFDVLFVVLAIASAYQIGSGSKDNPSEVPV